MTEYRRRTPCLAALLAGIAAAVLPLVGQAASVDAARRPLVLATGTLRGVHYAVGSALCTLFNAAQENGPRCVSLRSSGSSANIASLRRDEVQVALAQSDTQTAAYLGTGEFLGKGAFTQLRSLFALHSEYLAVLVRADSGIQQVSELKGRRVGVGATGSEGHAAVLQVLAAAGLSRQDLIAHREKGNREAKQLCMGKLDAAAYIGGSPNGHVTEIALACDVRLLPVTGPGISRLFAEHPEFTRGLVPGGRYRGNPDDTPTVSVTATVVTTAGQSEAQIYDFVRTVFDSFGTLSQLHPVLNEIEPREMVRSRGIAPAHPGALRFFRERGLMESTNP